MPKLFLPLFELTPFAGITVLVPPDVMYTLW